MAILLVDDETRLRAALARSLAARGHRVDDVATFGEAIAAIEGIEYDLLVLDVNLPDATGWDIPRALRAAGRAIPTVMLSAAPVSASRVREFQPLGILQKPFPIEALLRLVRSAGAGAGASPNSSR